MLTFDLFTSKDKFASPCICIGSIEVTCRSTVAKIVLIGNLRWPSSCLCLLYFPATVLFTCIKSISTKFHIDPTVEMWLIVYSNDHAPLTVRPIYSSSKLRTAQMMIFSLVAIIGLEKCCITSACLQLLCHSGERAVACENSKLFWNRTVISMPRRCHACISSHWVGTRYWSPLCINIPYAIKPLLLSTWIWEFP